MRYAPEAAADRSAGAGRNKFGRAKRARARRKKNKKKKRGEKHPLQSITLGH